MADPANREWLRYGGTWFAGVNALPNDGRGAVAGGPALPGDFASAVHQISGQTGFEWDRAQVSVCYPGYPRPMAGESRALYDFRVKRDAAHVDGLLREGPGRRRFLREHHAFILGIPMAEFGAGASPFVVFEGSHELVRRAFTDRFGDAAPGAWREIDVTETYQRVRGEIFERCRRVEIHGSPGEAFVVHRLALHGMAPWRDGAAAGADGRMICYFRPDIDPRRWLFDR